MDNFIKFFQSENLNHTRMFLILFDLAVALQILMNFRHQLRYFETQPTRIYPHPIPLLGKFKIPILDRKQFIISGIILMLSLIIAAIGYYPRFFLLISLFSYFLYFNPIMSLSYIQRKTNLIPIVLLILLFSPSIDISLDKGAEVWSIILIKIVIAQMYFSAGLQKLRRAGFRWANGESLQAYFLDHYLWSDTGLALRLAKLPILCRLLSVSVLFFELTFWIIIFLPSLTYFYLLTAFLFHFGIMVSMRINYLKYLSPVYLVFLTDIAFKIKTALEM